MSDTNITPKLELGLILIGLGTLSLLNAELWPWMLFVIAGAVAIPKAMAGNWRRGMVAPVVLVLVALGVILGDRVEKIFGESLGGFLSNHWDIVIVIVGLLFVVYGAVKRGNASKG